jgi:hypothetical protein
MPFISFVIPAYNVENFIEESLRSLQRQTDGDFEAIVVDDASTDSTVAVVRSLVAADPRFRLMAGLGTGPGAARNAALGEVRGEVLAFVDADDVVHPRYVEEIRRLRRSLADDEVLLLRYRRGETPSWPEAPERAARSVWPLDLALDAKAIWRMSCTCAFFRRHVGGFLTTHNYEDVVPTVRLMLHARRFVESETTLYFYRDRAGSLVQRRGRERIADASLVLHEMAQIGETVADGAGRHLVRLAQIWLVVGMCRLMPRRERRRFIPAALTAGRLTVADAVGGAAEMAWRSRGKRLQPTLRFILDVVHAQWWTSLSDTGPWGGCKERTGSRPS